MVRAFIEMILGEVGRQMLYFYEANACAINSVVLTYGVLMFASWNNLVRIYRFLIVEIAKTIHLEEDLNRKTTKKQVLESVEIPWEAAIEKSNFPFIARMAGLLPKRKTVENLKIYFDEKELAEQALKALKGADIRKMAPMTRKLQQREMDHKKKKSEKNKNKN
jgi:hypothetical protein